jgi:hypothetical protein
MKKSIITIICGAICAHTLPIVASPAYDQFKQKDWQQYQGEKIPDSCRLSRKQDKKYTYKLCQANGKLLYLIVYKNQGDRVLPNLQYLYGDGRLVQVYDVDNYRGYAFKKGKLVAVWNDETETLKTKLGEDDLALSSEIFASSQRILKLFGAIK